MIFSHAGGTLPFLAEKVARNATTVDFLQKAKTAQGTKEALTKIYVTASQQQASHDEVMQQLRSVYYDTALSANEYQFWPLQKLVSSSRILFGSDYLFAPESETQLVVHGVKTYAGFSAQDRQAIEVDNALKLFPRLQ